MWIEIFTLTLNLVQVFPSQPARAVWIEINMSSESGNYYPSHSLRGLCGLKLKEHDIHEFKEGSQPARAVWIEIIRCAGMGEKAKVTACEGCVD